MALLLPERVGSGHDSLGEAAPAIALGSERHFSPEDEGPQRSLGRVVHWLDPREKDECPHRLAVLEDVRTRAADAPNAQTDPVLQVAFDDGAEDRYDFLEFLARHRPVADAVPKVDHALGAKEQVLAQVTGRSCSLRKAREP